MNGYDKEKTLNEIIEDLAFYCMSKGHISGIKIVVPKLVLEEFSTSYLPIAKHKVEVDVKSTNDMWTIKKIHSPSGEVELYANEDVELTIKGGL